MGDFENKINDLLKSPESLEQIMKLARSLSGGEQTENTEGEKQESPKATPQPDFGAAFDPQIMGLLGSALKEYGSPSDTTALILALKPYLKQESRDKVDKAMQIAKLAKVAKTVIPEFGGSNNV